MACPNCGCKVHYQFNDADFGPDDERLERCAACGAVFDIEDSTDEEEDELSPSAISPPTPSPQVTKGGEPEVQLQRQWQPIETAPRDKDAWFWIRPKNDDETYIDTSDRPITATGEPHAVYTKHGRWGSLWKATHWMPNDPPASPQVQGDGGKGTDHG